MGCQNVLHIKWWAFTEVTLVSCLAASCLTAKVRAGSRHLFRRTHLIRLQLVARTVEARLVALTPSMQQ
jgi:hypothetical protein